MPAYGPDGRTLVKGATVTTASPRTSCVGGLSRRYNHSCDLTAAIGNHHDAFGHLKPHLNPIAQNPQTGVNLFVACKLYPYPVSAAEGGLKKNALNESELSLIHFLSFLHRSQPIS
ncbi:hypothetical protein L596_028499 [Steinernema carpocapsae]|uniref:Uncharacterized protein n=1 Tax=Steinernema carpocapsae TaxID=34508 RepID=A0A4U5LYL5_STECR|nr:hypothetical protein L596_028499 [Steinernema carpocapsae]